VLGLVTVSVCLLVVGALLVVANLTALQVMAAAVLATALVVVGLGLLVGARFGRSRGLMLLGVPLAAATLGDLGGVDAGGCRPGGPTLAAGEYYRAATHVPARGWGRHSGPVSAQRR